MSDLAATLEAPRRRVDPLWWRVLERFGLPTLLVLLLLGYVLRQGEAERRERVELLSGLRTAIEQQTVALRSLAAEQRAYADVVRLTWPRLRVSPPKENPE